MCVACPHYLLVSHWDQFFIEKKRGIEPSAVEKQDSLILKNDMTGYLLLCSEILCVILKATCNFLCSQAV